AGLAPARQVDGKRRIEMIELIVEMDRILAVGVANAVRRAGVNEDVIAGVALRHDRHLREEVAVVGDGEIAGMRALHRVEAPALDRQRLVIDLDVADGIEGGALEEDRKEGMSGCGRGATTLARRREDIRL